MRLCRSRSRPSGSGPTSTVQTPAAMASRPPEAPAQVVETLPLTVPPDATMGTDVVPLEAVGRLERWRFVGPGAWGGVRACRGGAPVERLLRTLMVALVADVVALLRLCTQVGAGWSRGFGVQRAMPGS